ncbi:hypothetical protein APHWI1_0297 [Anaplasma phagocytophilum str. ApWI1]|uniref:Uncharacterized protein n=2 Tax=Anaplasma phagocytophilum TaxID=948 RepID=A0A0F3N4M9_ANAPH|nr:hypothetical protein EPHNCH_1117 [Anaplasma phagocytophilum str. NCH-1]KJV84885.1 hypothetical protein APHWI1_0297 [Anaplasma phagocytophilum str. ApWI1]KJZ99547.1 hypothetical protein APHCR_0302 [Anaplasma phagocytophilum str. CR1007]KKA00363.1 hypothetical protein APHDU1_0095 [Anaplasma phagocytophilum]
MGGRSQEAFHLGLLCLCRFRRKMCNHDIVHVVNTPTKKAY